MEQSTNKKENTINISIPHDVALSILSRLPVKSLNRFGCVHTSWSNFLENPKFLSLYLQNLLSKDNDGSSILLWQQVSEGLPDLLWISGERFEKKVKLDWPPPCLEEDVKFIAIHDYCVNGAIGLIRSKGSYGDENVVLWNPTTKEFRVIPFGLSQGQGISFSFLVHTPGFWYDHVNDDYKFLQQAACFVDDSKDIVYFWRIYSLKGNSWKKLDLGPICASHICKPMGSVVNLNGSLHWWGTKHHDIGTEEDLLISFDMNNEIFHKPIGCPTNAEFVNRYLAVFNGSIAMISNYLWINCLDISILGEIGVKESWTKIFTIGPLPCFELPIGVGHKGDIFFIKEDGELDCFDLRTQMSKEIGVRGVNYNSKVLIYKESFLPFGGIKY
ncbi:F-box/kelch-repeat protein At3g06240 [Cajanus cajan]|uniref:F-box/kelch-repeat protein At3g06240 family n=1 Tax=Cajanus cajan TaxID=3821 RepID=A0A151RHR0_CAJCA|nr:F-box/kelch-repeat protein At3g06240 [Cajanus cajan]KYP41965.1 F-box/kelch-repeat protein At3g06240 family [Cajanus cajan]